MKKKDVVVKDAAIREFARSLPDDDLRFSCFRLSERKSGDIGDVLELIQDSPDMDRFLAAAKDADGVYDIIDEVQECLEREYSRRPRSN